MMPNLQHRSPSQTLNTVRIMETFARQGIGISILAEPFKLCPICDTTNHRNAAMCRMCGTTLADIEVMDNEAQALVTNWDYDYRYGETDLLEESLSRKARVYMGGIVLFLLVMMGVGLLLVFYPMMGEVAVSAATHAGIEVPSLFQTNTMQPTRLFPTVTEGAPTLTPSYTVSPTPTITPTFTRTPCMQTVQAGEGLYAVVSRCGHYSLDVIPLVVKANDLNDETDIFAGQILEVPWPTETPDPNATATAQAATSDSAMGDDLNTAALVSVEITQMPTFSPTPTLFSGLAFHTILKDENIITIAMLYNTNIEVLSQLNPEVTFSQCEMGQPYGGGSCIVLLYEGQVIRVPVPTPTPTLSPTPSGSETATPTATATYNAPNAISPGNRAYFRKDEVVTLRWGATGSLLPGQMYRVRVEDNTDQQVYIADTRDLFFTIPIEWHGQGNQRYEYAWTVSIIEESRPDEPRFTTKTLTFTWEGLGQ
jgi:hypothetical protein